MLFFTMPPTMATISFYLLYVRTYVKTPLHRTFSQATCIWLLNILKHHKFTANGLCVIWGCGILIRRAITNVHSIHRPHCSCWSCVPDIPCSFGFERKWTFFWFLLCQVYLLSAILCISQALEQKSPNPLAVSCRGAQPVHIQCIHWRLHIEEEPSFPPKPQYPRKMWPIGQ